MSDWRGGTAARGSHSGGSGTVFFAHLTSAAPATALCSRLMFHVPQLHPASDTTWAGGLSSQLSAIIMRGS